jgi:hypothetical protein
VVASVEDVPLLVVVSCWFSFVFLSGHRCLFFCFIRLPLPSSHPDDKPCLSCLSVKPLCPLGLLLPLALPPTNQPTSWPPCVPSYLCPSCLSVACHNIAAHRAHASIFCTAISIGMNSHSTMLISSVCRPLFLRRGDLSLSWRTLCTVSFFHWCIILLFFLTSSFFLANSKFLFLFFHQSLCICILGRFI